MKYYYHVGVRFKDDKLSPEEKASFLEVNGYSCVSAEGIFHDTLSKKGITVLLLESDHPIFRLKFFNRELKKSNCFWGKKFETMYLKRAFD